MNPYQAPSRVPRRRPFLVRLGCSLQRAWAAYHKGVARDGLTRSDQLLAWGRLLGLMLLIALLLFALIASCLDSIGFWSYLDENTPA